MYSVPWGPLHWRVRSRTIRGNSGEKRVNTGEKRGNSGEKRGNSGEKRGNTDEKRGNSGEKRRTAELIQIQIMLYRTDDIYICAI